MPGQRTVKLKQTAAMALAAALLVAGTYRIAGASEERVRDKNTTLKALVGDLRGETVTLTGENDDLKGLLSDLRDVCYAQADRLYELADKPDLAFPEELNLMQAKTAAGTWLENCREIAPEDVEAVTNVFAVADTTLDQATAAYKAATKKDNK